MSITDDEIISHILEISSGAMVRPNQLPAPERDQLVEVLDQVVMSAPVSPAAVSIACADPAVQVMLPDVARQAAPDTDHLRWLAGATIMSEASALCAVVTHQFPQAEPVVLANLDASGRPTSVDPLMLIGPTTSAVVGTAKAFDGSLSVSQPDGADALAKAMRSLPLLGLQITFIVIAGAGSEIDSVAIELTRTTGLPVRAAKGGAFAAAYGAALLAAGPSASATQRAFTIRPRKLVALTAILLVAVGVTAFSVIQHQDVDASTVTESTKPVRSTPQVNSTGLLHQRVGCVVAATQHPAVDESTDQS